MTTPQGARAELSTAITAAQLVVWLTVGGARMSRDEGLSMARRRLRTEMIRRFVRGVEEVAHGEDARSPRVVADRVANELEDRQVARFEDKRKGMAHKRKH